MKVPLSSPDITDKEVEAVVSVLRTNQLSLGPKTPEFEQKIARYVGTKHAVAVNSGTSALHLCVRALGIGDNDEVITTPFSFVASTNCFLFERAKPVFVDIREDTYNIDENKIEAAITPKTKAILPVHVFGYPAEMEKVQLIAAKHNLAVIEDSCEALGAEIDHRKVGSIGDCGVFAFYPNKQMTTGEGGIIVTNDNTIADTARSLRNQGRDSMAWLVHNRMGYNYRISDINCALGSTQIDRIEELLTKRAKVAERYHQLLSSIQGIVLPPTVGDSIRQSWFVYVIRLDDSFTPEHRDQLMELLRADEIGCNAYFPPIHLQPYMQQYGFKKGDFPVTEKVAQRTIAIPFFNNLTDEQIEYTARKLKSNLLKVKRHGK